MLAFGWGRRLRPDLFALIWFDEFECLQSVPSLDAIGSEVSTIDRKNLVEVFGLRHHDQ